MFGSSVASFPFLVLSPTPSLPPPSGISTGCAPAAAATHIATVERGFESIGALLDTARFKAALGDDVAERSPTHLLHDDERVVAVLALVEDGHDVRVIAESVNNAAAPNCMGRVHDVLFTPL